MQNLKVVSRFSRYFKDIVVQLPTSDRRRDADDNNGGYNMDKHNKGNNN